MPRLASLLHRWWWRFGGWFYVLLLALACFPSSFPTASTDRFSISPPQTEHRASGCGRGISQVVVHGVHLDAVCDISLRRGREGAAACYALAFFAREHQP